MKRAVWAMWIALAIVLMMIGVILGAAIAVQGQSIYTAITCDQFVRFGETARVWYVAGGVDVIFTLNRQGRLFPIGSTIYAGQPMAAFQGAVYGTCLNEPYSEVNRVIVRIMGF